MSNTPIHDLPDKWTDDIYDPEVLSDNIILGIEINFTGMEFLSFLDGHLGEGHDGETVTFFTEMGRGPVENDFLFTMLSDDHVGLETCAIGHIANQHFFVG